MSFRFNPLTGKLDLTSSSAGASLKLEVVPVTIVSPNTWTSVPLSTITTIADAEVYDQSNMEELVIDIRIVGGSSVEIKSSKIYTYTVHVEGL